MSDDISTITFVALPLDGYHGGAGAEIRVAIEDYAGHNMFGIFIRWGESRRRLLPGQARVLAQGLLDAAAWQDRTEKR